MCAQFQTRSQVYNEQMAPWHEVLCFQHTRGLCTQGDPSFSPFVLRGCSAACAVVCTRQTRFAAQEATNTDPEIMILIPIPWPGNSRLGEICDNKIMRQVYFVKISIFIDSVKYIHYRSKVLEHPHFSSFY